MTLSVKEWLNREGANKGKDKENQFGSQIDGSRRAGKLNGSRLIVFVGENKTLDWNNQDKNDDIKFKEPRSRDLKLIDPSLDRFSSHEPVHNIVHKQLAKFRIQSRWIEKDGEREKFRE